MKQEQVDKKDRQQARGKQDDSAATAEPVPGLLDEKLAEDTDDLLDEIDSVLEENAEEFVNSYIQQGGQ